MSPEPAIRKIQPEDNQVVKDLVISVLAEHGLKGEGYAGVDLEMEDMYASYDNPQSAFYVIEQADEILGVGGFAPLAGEDQTAELRKMYFKPALRGLGMGHRLLALCIQGAIDAGFLDMYLETIAAMKTAQGLYQKHGFKHITERMGQTGHSGCGVFMYRSLK